MLDTWKHEEHENHKNSINIFYKKCNKSQRGETLNVMA